MTNYTVRPISDRTAFTGKQSGRPFYSSWGMTESLLLEEIKKLGGHDVVIEIDVLSEDDIRLDGRLRANARVMSPAVRVAFESKHGPLTYATDRYQTWQDNVRAIALGLEALRKVDRYGISKRGEQYTGYRAIESGEQQMSRREALRLIHVDPDSHPDEMALRRAAREARRAAHPDMGGSREQWDSVQEAVKVLGL